MQCENCDEEFPQVDKERFCSPDCEQERQEQVDALNDQIAHGFWD